MSNSLEQLKQNISNFMSIYLENEGFSPLVGKMYTLLLFASEPISLQQMAEQLTVSKAAISVQIRTMELQHLCHKVPVQNDRKDYYYITEDFEGNIVRSEIGKYQSLKHAVDEALAGLQERFQAESGEDEACRLVKQRFKELSLLCDLFISHMRQMKEEWELMKPLL